jgi:hypothetical protein
MRRLNSRDLPLNLPSQSTHIVSWPVRISVPKRKRPLPSTPLNNWEAPPLRTLRALRSVTPLGREEVGVQEIVAELSFWIVLIRELDEIG